MRRRSLLLWTGAIVGGGVAAFGTGAYEGATARREVTVSVVDDAAAKLTLAPGPGDPGGFVTQNGNGVVGIDVGSVDNGTTTPGGGANEGTVTAIDDLLRIRNRGPNRVSVSASFPLGGGAVLYSGYGGPGDVAALDETGNAVGLDPGQATDVGLALDTGHGTSEIPGTFADGDTVALTVEAEAV